MYCLFNGEYGEHDLNIPSLEANLDTMEKNYAKWPGTVVGDFECLNVEYDWGKRDQRWTVKCNLCGEVSYRYHVQDWRRGKGAKITCHCRKDAEKTELEERACARKAERKSEREAKMETNRLKFAGNVFWGWKVSEDYNGKCEATITCVDCGKKRKRVAVKDLESGFVNSCNHKIPNDYSGEEWIGRKAGHLTAIGRDGMMFIAKCDCGEIIRVRPTDMFTSKRKLSCSSPNCPYCESHEKEVRQRHKRGFEYERNMEDGLRSLGFDARKTQDHADYGVDIIIYNEDGTKTAVQCKNQSSPSGVEAVQEVYAGGRFYDCERFAVICDKGFSTQAYNMAKKLGVYLCEGKFDPPKNVSDYCAALVPTYNFHAHPKAKKLYEIKGEKHSLAEWCTMYGKTEYNIKKILNKGVSLEIALMAEDKPTKNRMVTASGVTGTFDEVCAHFGVLPATVRYRMYQKGMTLEEAVLAKPMAKGRPKKNTQ